MHACPLILRYHYAKASLSGVSRARAERISVLLPWKTTGGKKQRKVCEKNKRGLRGTDVGRGRKSGPQIRRQEEEQGENRG